MRGGREKGRKGRRERRENQGKEGDKGWFCGIPFGKKRIVFSEVLCPMNIYIECLHVCYTQEKVGDLDRSEEHWNTSATSGGDGEALSLDNHS